MKKLNILGFLLISGTLASAGLITYTESVVGTGTFDGLPFTNQTVTLTETADTSGITGPGTYFLPGTTTVTVPGIGTGTFSDQIEAFSCTSCPDGGFWDITLGRNMVYNLNPAFATYYLATPIGPLTGSAYVDTATYATSFGSFAFTSGSANATFTAVATSSSVPEPGTLTLLGAGMALVIAGRWRSRRK